MFKQRSFEIKQIADKPILNLYLYGEIQADYTDWWSGKIVKSTTSADYVRKAVEEAGNVAEINVYINSIGGSVAEGNAIYNILKRQSAPVTVYVDAFAYSVASVIAMAGDKVIMPSNTTMMIHNARMGAYGTAEMLRKVADDLDTINEASCNTYLIKSNGKVSKEKLTEMLNAETYLTADEALKYGFCDEVANPINFTNVEEIIEQAKQLNNPNCKAAAEFLKTNQKKPNDDFKGNSFFDELSKAFEKYFK